jgi:hypothetical protein
VDELARMDGAVGVVRRLGASVGRSAGTVRLGADVGAAAAFVLLLAAPLLFTNNGFMADFTNHLWLVLAQAHALVAAHHPSYFIQTTPNVFEPFFAFDGGSLYATSGTAATLLGGHYVVAYVGTAIVAMVAAYGGLLWLARQLGLRNWTAHAPALTFVASAYYVTNLYGRGDWPEFVAVSTIPLLIASATHLLRASRWTPLPVALFVVAAIYFTGSHNITLLWGSIVLVVSLAVLSAALGVRRVSRSRALRLVALLALAAAVNAWFLLPDVLYGGQTAAGRGPFRWSATAFLNDPRVLFDPLRTVPRESSTPGLFVQVPDWFLAWALVAIAVLWRGASRNLRRAFLALTGILAALLVLITSSAPWDVLPFLLGRIQFAYRLNTYVALAVAGLVLVAAIAIQHRSECEENSRVRTIALHAALAVAAMVSVALCVWQLWIPATGLAGWTYPDRRAALVSPHVLPRTWYAPVGYADTTLPVIRSHQSLLFEPELVRGDRLVQTVTPPPGLVPFSTNIVASELVTMRGIVPLGRTRDGHVVARRAAAGGGPVRVLVERADPWPVTVGTGISIAAVAALLGLLGRHLWLRRTAPARAARAERGSAA